MSSVASAGQRTVLLMLTTAVSLFSAMSTIRWDRTEVTRLARAEVGVTSLARVERLARVEVMCLASIAGERLARVQRPAGVAVTTLNSTSYWIAQ
jgi:hypothetical protein